MGRKRKIEKLKRNNLNKEILKKKRNIHQINKSIPNKVEMSYYIRDHKIKPRKVQMARTRC